MDSIDKVQRCNIDRSIGTNVPLGWFTTTAAIWRNHHKLVALT